MGGFPRGELSRVGFAWSQESPRPQTGPALRLHLRQGPSLPLPKTALLLQADEEEMAQQPRGLLHHHGSPGGARSEAEEDEAGALPGETLPSSLSVLPGGAKWDVQKGRWAAWLGFFWPSAQPPNLSQQSVPSRSWFPSEHLCPRLPRRASQEPLTCLMPEKPGMWGCPKLPSPAPEVPALCQL